MCKDLFCFFRAEDGSAQSGLFFCCGYGEGSRTRGTWSPDIPEGIPYHIQSIKKNLHGLIKMLYITMYPCYNDTVERGTGIAEGAGSASRVSHLVGRCKTTFIGLWKFHSWKCWVVRAHKSMVWRTQASLCITRRHSISRQYLYILRIVWDIRKVCTNLKPYEKKGSKKHD